MALSDKIYNLKQDVKNGSESASSCVVGKIGDAKTKVVNTYDKVKTTVTKDLKGKTIYQDFYDNNRELLAKFMSSVDAGDTNVSLAVKIKDGIDGMSYSKVLGNFKFSHLIYSPKERLLSFKSVKFPNVDFYKFLEIVLDGFCTKQNVEDVFTSMRSLGKEGFKNGFIDSPCVFSVLPSDSTYLNYSVSAGSFILNESNVTDINVLNKIKTITCDVLPVFKESTNNDFSGELCSSSEVIGKDFKEDIWMFGKLEFNHKEGLMNFNGQDFKCTVDAFNLLCSNYVDYYVLDAFVRRYGNLKNSIIPNDNISIDVIKGVIYNGSEVVCYVKNGHIVDGPINYKPTKTSSPNVKVSSLSNRELRGTISAAKDSISNPIEKSKDLFDDLSNIELRDTISVTKDSINKPIEKSKDLFNGLVDDLVNSNTVNTGAKVVKTGVKVVNTGAKVVKDKVAVIKGSNLFSSGK